jgi:hypothetical protein
MKWASGLILVVAIGTAGAAQEAATDKEKTPDYYPLKPGTKWFYELNGNGQKIKLQIQVSKIETIDGNKMALVETVINGMVTGTEHVTATEKGVFRHRMNGIELSPPVCILKYPYKKDDTWEGETTVGAEKIMVKGKALGDEEVSVPAGKYKTVKADTETSGAGMKMTASLWFAPDVGLVKQTIAVQDKTLTFELEKFEAGK